MLCETIVRLPFGRSRQSGIVVKLEKNILFPAKKFVLSMIVRIFAAREPAKPLNDAQMCVSFLFSLFVLPCLSECPVLGLKGIWSYYKPPHITHIFCNFGVTEG